MSILELVFLGLPMTAPRAKSRRKPVTLEQEFKPGSIPKSETHQREAAEAPRHFN
jgi:hypothetical protein